MKPVVLHLAYSLDFGGVETHMRLIAEHGGAAFEHRFMAIAGGGEAERAIRAAGAEVPCLGLDPWRRPIAAARALRRQFTDMAPAVVHAHGSEPNLFGLWTAKTAGVTVRIGEEIGLPDHSAKARLALRAAYTAADRVIGVSDAVRDFLVRSGEVPVGKALRVYNPVRESPLHAAARKEDEPLRIVFLGRLEPLKNPRPLIEAAVALAEGGMPVTLTLLGDGGLRGELEMVAAGCPAVKFAGYQVDPWPLLASHHLLVQPSLTEGFSIALIEAMSAALPVLAAPVGGNPEVVVDGSNGWLLDGDDAAAIAEAIVRIERLDGGALTAIGMAGRESVAGRFGITRYIEEIEGLYSAVLVERRA